MITKQKLKIFLFFWSILLFIQTFLFDIQLITTDGVRQYLVIYNKILIRFSVPFIKLKPLSNVSFKDKILLFHNKDGHLSIAKVISEPGDIIKIENNRFFLPNNYFYSKKFTGLEENKLGYIHKKNIVGTVIYMLQL